MGEKKKTAVYLRLSNEDAVPDAGCGQQKESGSITSQRKYLLEYISRDSRLADSEVVEFCDDGFTGTDMERPGMQKLLKQVRQNRIGCILVKDMSRFSRDYIEMGTYLNQIFPFMGVDFIAVNDGYDSRENGGSTIELDTAFQTLLYDLYSKDVSVKVKTAFDSKCADGEYVFGQVPLGYGKSAEEKNKVIVNEREAEIVRSIFSMAADGMSTTQIAKRLFDEGIPTATQIRRPDRRMKENHTWSSAAVRKILDNRFYLGEMAYGKTVRKSVGSKKGTAVPKSEWKVIRNHHEPLVSPEVFARAASGAPGHSAKHRRTKHPLVGKTCCGACGYSVSYKPKNTGKAPGYFWCRKHALLQIPDCCTYFNAAVLEEIVRAMLEWELAKRGELLKQRGALEQFQKEQRERLAGKMREYRKQYRDRQKEKDILYEDYAAGGMDAQEYRNRADLLSGQMEELSDKIKETEAEYGRTEAEHGDIEAEYDRTKAEHGGIEAEYGRTKAEHGGIEAEHGRDRQDMKALIRGAHLEKLTQAAADVFLSKVAVYKGRRVEIEWSFSE